MSVSNGYAGTRLVLCQVSYLLPMLNANRVLLSAFTPVFLPFNKLMQLLHACVESTHAVYFHQKTMITAQQTCPRSQHSTKHLSAGKETVGLPASQPLALMPTSTPGTSILS